VGWALGYTAAHLDHPVAPPLFATGDLWMIDYLDVSSIDLRCCVCCFFMLHLQDIEMFELGHFVCYKRLFEMLQGTICDVGWVI
jgi:hypothetical protein